MFKLIPTLLISLPLIAVAAPASDLDEAVKAATGSNETIQYRYALLDLNGDEKLDALVIISERKYCGSGGCTMFILKAAEGGYSVVSRSTITREPVYLLNDTHSGWRSFSVLQSGGGEPGRQVLMRFNGTRYPLNPSLQKTASYEEINAGKQVLLAFAHPAWAKRLITPTYEIRIESECDPSREPCYVFTYTGTNRKTGQSIQLWGRMGDPSSAGNPFEYRFNNGNIDYTISQGGTLEVVGDGGKILVHEEGQWEK